jgi:hypothetical protein
MSQFNVDAIVNKSNDGPPILSIGCTIGDGRTLSATAGARVDGSLTATSFVGDGSGITNLPNVDAAKVFALKLITVFDEYRT